MDAWNWQNVGKGYSTSQKCKHEIDEVVNLTLKMYKIIFIVYYLYWFLNIEAQNWQNVPK